MSERRSDHDTRGRVDRIETKVDAGLGELERGRKANRKAIRWLAWAFTLLAAGMTVLVLVALDQADENRQRINDINDSRAFAIRTTCQATNERHNNAIDTLDKLIAKAPKSDRGKARQGRASTILLIDALVPLEDCEQRVFRLTEVTDK